VRRRTPRAAIRAGVVGANVCGHGTRVDSMQISTERVARTVEDTIYTAVGLGVLGFQHLQVQRHELKRSLSSTIESVEERLSHVLDRARGAR
jgi:predicted urease superfamily metal-dependent hydrolase